MQYSIFCFILIFGYVPYLGICSPLRTNLQPPQRSAQLSGDQVSLPHQENIWTRNMKPIHTVPRVQAGADRSWFSLKFIAAQISANSHTILRRDREDNHAGLPLYASKAGVVSEPVEPWHPIEWVTSLGVFSLRIFAVFSFLYLGRYLEIQVGILSKISCKNVVVPSPRS
ncbi:hypothetical protein M413DRAFT_445232 [Hebeloma cylindrosporum]|uniref:Uncharacterized protein n=1 Tax=Hebeloma cylindrosporum TaxID=76867 RepID=A0A0C2YM31_HEBCY|nr:hypothetical protein M413DRAFT_445232 [Hebeloma cylindrosporum h7]